MDKNYLFSSGEDFELYKSNACHYVKQNGDIEFIRMMRETNAIEECFTMNRNKEGFYLLGMADYLCNINNIPKIKKFDQYRNKRLKNMVFPRGILLLSLLSEPDAKERAVDQAIPEFLKYNIVEGNIRNLY